MPNDKIPERRKIKIKYKDPNLPLVVKDRVRTAFNLGVALAAGSNEFPELKLILVEQKLYPLHMFSRMINDVMVIFKGGSFGVCPGKIEGINRINFIGPRYNSIIAWSPIPLMTKQKAEAGVDAYTMMQDLVAGRSNNYYEQIEKSFLNESFEYISRRQVAM